MVDRVVTASGCWQRPIALTKNGYCLVGGGRRGVRLYAHRVSFEAAKGPIPAGLEIDHLCRNRACFNPAHIEAVTRGENIHRGVLPEVLRAKHLREITSCKNGHPFDEENTRWRLTGGRACKTCERTRSAAHDAKRRQRN